MQGLACGLKKPEGMDGLFGAEVYQVQWRERGMIGIFECEPRTNSITMRAYESSNCAQPVQGWQPWAWDEQMC